MATPPPSITPAPQPPPQRGDRATFSDRVDRWVTWMSAAPAEFQAVASNTYTNAQEAFGSANSAAASASGAVGARDAAITARDQAGASASSASTSANNAAASALAAKNSADSASAVTGIPPVTGNATKSLRVNAAGTAMEWVQDGAALGFTPVQQGGGTGQDSVKVNIGRATGLSSALRVALNGADVGYIPTSSTSPASKITYPAPVAAPSFEGAGSALTGITASQVGTMTSGGVARTQAAKNTDVITPKDFGAVVNGAADDTAAVTQAAAYANAQMVPALVPKRARSTLTTLVGTERIQTAYSEPSETDLIGVKLQKVVEGATLVIDCYGDSTMWGADTANLSNQAPEPSPARLQAILQRYYNNYSITVRNRAISGSSIEQMLAGTGSYTQPFEQVMAESNASIVYMNHCINSEGSVDADEYKRSLHKVAEIIRKYGKSPVFCTPNPVLAFALANLARTEKQKLFAQVMRQVCKEAAIPMVDNYTFVMKALQSGKYRVNQVIPDGVHPSNEFYGLMGQNMAIPLIAPSEKFSAANAFLPGISPQVRVTSGNGAISQNSRMGGATVTGTVGVQSLCVAFVVDEPGLDIYVAAPLWENGSTVAGCSIDRVVVVPQFNFNTPTFSGGTFIQDHEYLLISNATPGLHFVEFDTNGGGLGIYYVRTRKTFYEKSLFTGASSNYRKRLLQDYEHFSTSANGVALLDEFPTPHLLDNFDFEFTASLGVSEGVVVSGSVIADEVSLVSYQAGFIVGLDDNGFVSVWENRTGVYTKVLTGPTDVRNTRAKYYVSVKAGGNLQISVFRAGAMVGTATLTKKLYGGLFGFWKAGVGSFTVEYVDRLQRSV